MRGVSHAPDPSIPSGRVTCGRYRLYHRTVSPKPKSELAREHLGRAAEGVAEEDSTEAVTWLLAALEAAIAGGFTFDVRPELAADCIDEWLELAVAVNSDFAGRVALLATDEELGGRGDWTIGGGTWTRSSGVADVTLTGTVRDLLLVTTRRCTPAEAGVDVSGDVELLATWLDGMKF